MQAIRLGDFMGVRYGIVSHDDPFEIFDVARDPKQTQNVAAEHPDLQAQMHGAVLRMRRPETTAKRPYDSELVPAVKLESAVRGIERQTFTQPMPWLAKLDEMEPAGRSTALKIVGESLSESSTAALFTGYLEAPADGEFSFTIPAGAEAVLRLHDATVIDAGFRGSLDEKSGTIKLAAGKHPFRFYWRATGGHSAPQLDWAHADKPRQPIPPSAFFRQQL